MKTRISPEAYRIMRVYQHGAIQFRDSVLRRATDLPRETLCTVLDVLVRDGLLTVRCVSGDHGVWENLYTLTSSGCGVVEQIKTRKRSDVRYRI